MYITSKIFKTPAYIFVKSFHGYTKIECLHLIFSHISLRNSSSHHTQNLAVITGFVEMFYKKTVRYYLVYPEQRYRT
jgi:hypothetical protein